MTAVMEPATDHDCQCGSRARLWVDIGLADPEPLCRFCAHRAQEEFGFAEALAATYREPCEGVLPPFRLPEPVASPPPSRFHMAGVAFAARLATEPELRQKYVEAGRRLSAMRRACNQCDRVTSPGGIGLHQRHTGHSGWEAVR